MDLPSSSLASWTSIVTRRVSRLWASGAKDLRVCGQFSHRKSERIVDFRLCLLSSSYRLTHCPRLWSRNKYVCPSPPTTTRFLPRRKGATFWGWNPHQDIAPFFLNLQTGEEYVYWWCPTKVLYRSQRLTAIWSWGCVEISNRHWMSPSC